jgi:hypothetical protein
VAVESIFNCEILSLDYYPFYHYFLGTHLTMEMKTAVGFRTEDTDAAAAASDGS